MKRTPFIPLTDWQRAALNAFGLHPVYLSLDTTPTTLILHAAREYIITSAVARQLRQLNVRATTSSTCPDARYFTIEITALPPDTVSRKNRD